MHVKSFNQGEKSIKLYFLIKISIKIWGSHNHILNCSQNKCKYYKWKNKDKNKDPFLIITCWIIIPKTYFQKSSEEKISVCDQFGTSILTIIIDYLGIIYFYHFLLLILWGRIILLALIRWILRARLVLCIICVWCITIVSWVIIWCLILIWIILLTRGLIRIIGGIIICCLI
jgi:hypothetical protein